MAVVACRDVLRDEEDNDANVKDTQYPLHRADAADQSVAEHSNTAPVVDNTWSLSGCCFPDDADADEDDDTDNADDDASSAVAGDRAEPGGGVANEASSSAAEVDPLLLQYGEDRSPENFA